MLVPLPPEDLPPRKTGASAARHFPVFSAVEQARDQLRVTASVKSTKPPT